MVSVVAYEDEVPGCMQVTKARAGAQPGRPVASAAGHSHRKPAASGATSVRPAPSVTTGRSTGLDASAGPFGVLVHASVHNDSNAIHEWRLTCMFPPVCPDANRSR